MVEDLVANDNDGVAVGLVAPRDTVFINPDERAANFLTAKYGNRQIIDERKVICIASDEVRELSLQDPARAALFEANCRQHGPVQIYAVGVFRHKRDRPSVVSIHQPVSTQEQAVLRLILNRLGDNPLAVSVSSYELIVRHLTPAASLDLAAIQSVLVKGKRLPAGGVANAIRPNCDENGELESLLRFII